ncbi:dihydroxyacetone kinase 1 [Trypanosoma rangeli SC58]|uniref:Dihydroxyacetone kinase 1 n=1 Tax=Trypanosoma rangeli SC58 TaxID=429131 RepID=A0A061J727_TRYRA|nr:dihydroxyacetone kinase 1 [Trypanosoma rangeli SC58]
MVTTKFIDSADTAVDTAVKALCMTLPHLQVIENTHVVVKRDLDPTQVFLICGGGAGHEPAHVGFVNSGWLSAAVSGDVFASPPSSHVSAAIDYLHGKQGPNGPGILVIVKNYMGDILNFQFAVDEAQERGINVEMVMAADDACFGMADATRRGIAGTVLLYKILGAAALRGEGMAALKQLAARISSEMRSVGASLSSCSLPGSKPSSVVPHGLVEVGLGIHGEKGLDQIPFEGAKALVSHLLGILLGGGERRETHAQGDVFKDWEGAKVALLVNNLGSTTDIEMGILTFYALEQLRQAGMDVVGVSVGRHMTALEMHGFSFTLLRFSNCADVAFLFEPQQAPLMPFTVPQYSLAPAPGCRTALQLAREEQQRGTQCSCVLGETLEAVFQVLRGSEDYLNNLDAAVGDGDIGSGTKRAALGALEILPHLPLQTNVGRSFALLAKTVADAFGGSSGPLYGAFLLAAGAAASETMGRDGSSSVDAIRAALKAGSANIQRIARSKKGERTMVDVLEALNESPTVNAATSIQELARACAEVAKNAAAETALLPAKHGRSRYLKGKEVGQPDPGAELVVLWIRTAANALLPQGNL